MGYVTKYSIELLDEAAVQSSSLIWVFSSGITDHGAPGGGPATSEKERRWLMNVCSQGGSRHIYNMARWRASGAAGKGSGTRSSRQSFLQQSERKIRCCEFIHRLIWLMNHMRNLRRDQFSVPFLIVTLCLLSGMTAQWLMCGSDRLNMSWVGVCPDKTHWSQENSTC